MPSLDDWERQWRENPPKVAKPAVVQVDFKGQGAGRVVEQAGEAMGFRGRRWSWAFETGIDSETETG